MIKTQSDTWKPIPTLLNDDLTTSMKSTMPVDFPLLKHSRSSMFATNLHFNKTHYNSAGNRYGSLQFLKDIGQYKAV